MALAEAPVAGSDGAALDSGPGCDLHHTRVVSLLMLPQHMGVGNWPPHPHAGIFSESLSRTPGKQVHGSMVGGYFSVPGRAWPCPALGVGWHCHVTPGMSLGLMLATEALRSPSCHHSLPASEGERLALQEEAVPHGDA
jgi:hypothetical protein